MYQRMMQQMANAQQYAERNTFTLDGTIPADEMQELIDTSYQLVVAKLPKSKRPA